jgi:hypothetical protein
MDWSMNVILSLLIVAVSQDAPTEERFPAEAEVFFCDFGPDWDKNFDRWPDGWKREQGRGFPSYLNVSIGREPGTAGRRYLGMDLDGGAAAARSPPIAVASIYGYVLEVLVKTDGLVHDRAFLSMALLDEKQRRLETFYSQRVCQTQGWQKLRLGPMGAADERVRYAVIGLHLEPGERADLNGAARFADVWMGRLPRLSATLNSTDHVYTEAAGVEVRCAASGFSDRACAVDLLLQDEMGRPISRVRQDLAARPALPESLPLPTAGGESSVPLAGSTVWKPPIPGPGFYRIDVQMTSRKGPMQRRELTLAVIPPQRGAARGEFGWSLPRGDDPLPLPILAQLLGQVGIHWVKYPLWFGRKTGDPDIEQLILFGERLNGRGIEMVGLLSRPPEEFRKQLSDDRQPQAADLFSGGPESWYPSLESVLIRLATRVRWWQLGGDEDASFVGYPGLAIKIAQIKKQMDQIGQDVNLGFGWDWIHEAPQAHDGNPAWRFLALSADPPLTRAELGAYLAGAGPPGVQRWVSLTPLPRSGYATGVRATDLVQRMMAAKIHGAGAVFLTDPFDPQCGVMNDDGTAGELLLPWRTAALALGGTEYLGSIQLPEGSQNQVFSRGETAMMVVWNEKPVREVLYLGERVEQMDLWGRTRTPATRDRQQTIEVGPEPSFVVGLNKAVACWRRDFAFHHTRIPSVFGIKQDNSFRLKNGFSRGVTGSAQLVLPEGWMIEPLQTSFRLETGQSQPCPFRIGLPYTAANGHHKVRVDFEVQAERTYRFSVYGHMDLGLNDVYIEIDARINSRGELEVQQEFINETDRKVTFRCELYAPDRRMLTTQVADFGPGRVTRTYRLPKADELIGKTLWLRAAEIGGPRVLNYRFAVK